MTTAVMTDLELMRPRMSGAIGHHLPGHVMRRAMAAAQAAPGGWPPEGLVIGIVGGATAVHSSGLAAATAVRPPVRMVPAPASLPIAEIVARLNAAQPPSLLAYATKLPELAREQRAGRLRLRPRSVTSMSEAITPAERAAAAEAFGVPVTDMFVSTEGLAGHSEPGGAVLTFASDTCLAECADEEGRPVADGVPSARVLVTNLHNLTQPMIRYELTDRFTPAGTSAGGALRASVEGRTDDVFRYPEASVHPFVLGAPLLHDCAVREYQIRQTERGADIAAVTDGDFDPAGVVAAVERILREAGVGRPQVGLRRVGALDRDPMPARSGGSCRCQPRGPQHQRRHAAGSLTAAARPRRAWHSSRAVRPGPRQQPSRHQPEPVARARDEYACHPTPSGAPA